MNVAPFSLICGIVVGLILGVGIGVWLAGITRDEAKMDLDDEREKP